MTHNIIFYIVAN